MSRQSRKVPILIVRRIKVLSTELRAKSQVILSFDEQLFFALHRRSLPDPIQHCKLWIFHYNRHLKNITLGSETKKKKCECCHPKCCDCLCQKLETSVHAGATMLALFAFDSLQPCSLHLALYRDTFCATDIALVDMTSTSDLANFYRLSPDGSMVSWVESTVNTNRQALLNNVNDSCE
jgi:hypothetical protein